MIAKLCFAALLTIAQTGGGEGVVQTSSNPTVVVAGQKWVQVTPTLPLTFETATQGDLHLKYLPFVTAKGTVKYKLMLETKTKRYAVSVETTATKTLVKGPSLYAGTPTQVTLPLTAGDTVRIIPQQGATGGGVQYSFTPRKPVPPPVPKQAESAPAPVDKAEDSRERTEPSERLQATASVPGGLYSGALLGYRAGFGEVSSLELRATAGRVYPLTGAHALDFGVGLGVYGDSGTLRTRSGGFRRVSDWSVVAVPIGIGGAYRYDAGEAALFVGAAMEAHLLFADIATSTDEPGVGPSQTSDFSVAFGPRTFAAASVAAGPGEVFLEAFLSAPIWNNDVERYTGTLTASGGLVGYRYTFKP